MSLLATPNDAKNTMPILTRRRPPHPKDEHIGQPGEILGQPGKLIALGSFCGDSSLVDQATDEKEEESSTSDETATTAYEDGASLDMGYEMIYDPSLFRNSTKRCWPSGTSCARRTTRPEAGR